MLLVKCALYCVCVCVRSYAWLVHVYVVRVHTRVH